MTREDKDSLIEMLAKIHITESKGSLICAIRRLLRVIDISESSIMIPTLLKDKCEFDAYETLILAKILKASILGHDDLVEFYMSESSLHLNHSFPPNKQHHHRNPSTTPSLGSSASESTTSSRCTPLPSQTDELTQLDSKDSSATMRLLLHIEQLKTFIPQVTSLFEDIVELYKNSIDNVT